MKFSIGQKVLAFFGLGLLLIFVISMISYRSITKLIAAADGRKHSYEVLNSVGRVLAGLRDIDVASRSFAVTGRENDLTLARSAERRLKEDIFTIKTLTADNPAQKKRIERLDPLIEKNLAFSRQVIDTRRSRGHAAADALLRGGAYRGVMARIRRVVGEMEREEEKKLPEREATVQRSTGRTLSAILWGNLSAMGVFLLFSLIAQRELVQRKRTETALAETEERFRLMVEGVKDYAIIMLDNDGRIVSWNEGAQRISGFRAEDVLGRHFSLLYPGEDVLLGKPEQTLKTAADAGRFEEEGWRMHRDGTRFWANAIITALRDEAGNIRGFSKVTRDITERKRAEESMRKLSMSVEQATDLIMLTDRAGSIEYVNKAVEEISGYGKDELIGKNWWTWQAELNDERTLAEREDALRFGQHFQAIITNRRKSGEIFSVYEVVTPLKDVQGNITHYVSTGRDITRQKSMEEKLEHLAYYDALTDIPNRALFIDRLSQALARARHAKKTIGVLVVDIDLFKFINEAYGFSVGDDVLKAIGGRLIASVREGDTVARLGSDDFGVLLNDVAHSDDIILVVKKLMASISQPLKVHGEEIILTATLGIAVYPNDGEDNDTLMKNVDLALARAKQMGRNSYRFYTRDMNVKAVEFVSIDKGLLKSFQNREFMMYYQPYWDINTQKMMGMEALLRWNSTDRGVISPDKFISVLEDTGMIIEVGDWIMKAVCSQVREWRGKGRPLVPVSVNISSVQFRSEDLAEKILAVVEHYGIDPKLLTLEITESTFMKNVELTGRILGKLKEAGMSVSLDDFGTGYSSLSYLKKFPFDSLKIDISFVRDLAIGSDTTKIVSAIIAMARSLNLKTIAEGVETEELWKILRLLQCDMAQGNYFSPPLPPQGVEIYFEP
jgi:diguanylate cyclase (GGDEF)-like protein/PAS domain S-box-containing protein